MKRFLILLMFAILLFPLMAMAGDDNKRPSLLQDLKQVGKEVKESAKDVGKEIKKDAKDAGKEMKEAGNKAIKDLKKTGKEAKASGKGFTHTLKKSLKQAGKAFSDAWHGFLDFLGLCKDSNDKDKKIDIPSENVQLYSLRDT